MSYRERRDRMGEMLADAVEEMARAIVADAAADSNDSCAGWTPELDRIKKKTVKVVAEIMDEAHNTGVGK